VIVFVPLILFGFLSGAVWAINIAFFTLMYAALATSWNLVGGYTGYITLGNISYFGLGAYALSIPLVRTGSVGSGWWPFALVPLIGLVAGLVSLPIGWVAYRTRGVSFIIVTITTVIMLQYLAVNWGSLTGGPQGLSLPLPPFGPGTYERTFFFAMLVIYAIALAICWYVRKSRLGLMMFAVREDEDKAEGVGIKVNLPKLAAFGISAGMSAMTGAVWAYYLSNIYPSFAFDAEFLSVAVVLVAFLGGTGTLWGPTVGAFILIPAQQYLAFSLGASDLYLIGYAVVFIVVMLTLRRGVVPSITDFMARRRRRRFHQEFHGGELELSDLLLEESGTR
jgi:branched-chain amino acid transport system permease protein